MINTTYAGCAAVLTVLTIFLMYEEMQTKVPKNDFCYFALSKPIALLLNGRLLNDSLNSRLVCLLSWITNVDYVHLNRRKKETKERTFPSLKHIKLHIGSFMN